MLDAILLVLALYVVWHFALNIIGEVCENSVVKFLGRFAYYCVGIGMGGIWFWLGILYVSWVMNGARV